MIDWTDDSVYSNIAYPLAALAGGGWQALLVALTGFNLGAGSAYYHASYTSAAAKWDVWAMLLYLVSLCICVTRVYTAWVWALLPVAVVYYWWRTPVGNMILMGSHVSVWGLATLVPLALRVGWWAFFSAGLFSAAVVVRLVLHEDSDGPIHSSWHLLSAAAAASVLWLI